MDAEDEDKLVALSERLHAARRALREAYERRDILAEEASALERDPDARVRPELMMALSMAERVVLEAETEMKDAEYALAVAGEPARRGERI